MFDNGFHLERWIAGDYNRNVAEYRGRDSNLDRYRDRDRFRGSDRDLDLDHCRDRDRYRGRGLDLDLDRDRDMMSFGE